MRLVDRLASPMSVDKKKILIDNFEKKLKDLNKKMRKAKNDEAKEVETHLSKARSQRSTKRETADHKKETTMLYSQYNDVILISNGSFLRKEVLSITPELQSYMDFMN